MSEGEKRTEKAEIVPDPDLDSLLDDALQDFTKPQPSALSQPVNVDLASAMASMGVNVAAGGTEATQNVWTEEFIQQATANFEKTMRALMEQQQGNLPSSASSQVQETEKDKSTSETSPTSAPAEGSSPSGSEIPEGSIDFSTLSADFAKFAQAAAKAAAEAPSDGAFTDTLAETMKQLSQNNEQLKSVPTADDMTKMFENLGLGGGEGEEGGFGGLFPLMQVMLENILSKEVLYPPMKEITDKYPDWLADHRTSLPEEEYDRYNKQYDVMKQVVQLYEEEQDSDSDEVKGQRFEKVMQFMQKLQEMGQPPKDLVGDLGPMINFDESGNPVLPDMSTLLGAAGFPGGAGVPTEAAPGGGASGEQPQEGEQCSIM
ncbi:peroxisomal biogenesis factor 19 [Palaemon carinicauda]|uniref:peroxisomal biogenesis factor 19 n=1 Tax=Palaemon carinicauda TaxID=392227 RepID=UPI0035B583AC